VDGEEMTTSPETNPELFGMPAARIWLDIEVTMIMARLRGPELERIPGLIERVIKMSEPGHGMKINR
jgi:hypothetical protein